MPRIEPDLFARLMQLPETVRCDLLEFLGATPVGSEELSGIIDRFGDERDRGFTNRRDPVPAV